MDRWQRLRRRWQGRVPRYSRRYWAAVAVCAVSGVVAVVMLAGHQHLWYWPALPPLLVCFVAAVAVDRFTHDHCHAHHDEKE